MSKLSMNLVTKCVKNNSQNFKINLEVNKEFEQDNKFHFSEQNETVNKTNELEIDTNNENISNGFIIKNETMINIPSELNNIFDNLLEDNYYLYGLNKEFSFILSLLYIISSDFKFKSCQEREKFAKILIEDLTKNIDVYFSNGYSNLNMKKTSIIDNLNKNIFSSNEVYYISDYYNINLVIVNMIKNDYVIGKKYEEGKKNVIIIKYNDNYIPLVHMFGETPNDLIFKCVLNKLKIDNDTFVEQQSIVETLKSKKQFIEENITIELKDKYSLLFNTKNKLKALSAFKLQDLKNIFESNNINIENIKTKKDYYEAIINYIRELLK